MPIFKAVTEDRYDEMLGAVPPAAHNQIGFLVGEAWTGKACEATDCQQKCRNRYDCDAFRAFVERAGSFYECLSPMTIGEFRALDLTRYEVRDEHMVPTV